MTSHDLLLLKITRTFEVGLNVSLSSLDWIVEIIVEAIVKPGGHEKEGKEEEEDPLDAFMSSLDEQVRRFLLCLTCSLLITLSSPALRARKILSRKWRS